MKHRTDIDGLRSLAILPILLFHAGVTALPGGFLGVDVFFVISGFLITSIILREMDGGEFSIATFYRKRIVRIFPALFVMLLFVLIVGCAMQLPFELEKVGYASASAAAFISNIYYWRTTDYFSGFAETNPLLHTWSLGVEEQFYILYPLFLMIVRRFLPGYIKAALLALVLLSAAAALIMVHIQTASAFYLLPARAWQLAIGGLVAVGGLPAVGKAGRNLLAWTGIALIVAGIALVQSDWTLPLPWGLLPSGGAALIIAYAEDSSAHRVLAWFPLRWIGAISYSLYLWHWPLITFFRIRYGLELQPVDTAGLVAASVLVAAISYYCIEQPILRRYRQGRSTVIIGIGVAGLLAMVGLSIGIARHPAGWRNIAPEVVRISSFADYKSMPQHALQYREGLCFSTETSAPYDYKRCPELSEGKRNIALIGDSHGAQYWLALQKRFPRDNVIQLTSSGCRILLDSKGPKRCEKLMDYAFGPFVDRNHLDHVILAGRWQLGDAAALTRTIGYLRSHGIPVTVIGPIDEFEGDFPLLLARATEMGHPENMERFRLKTKAAIDAGIEATVKAAGAGYYSVRKAECAGGCIYLGANAMPLHFDYGHLTQDGAEHVLRNFPNF